MGIKASATCVINFDGATGWLVGEPHKGMAAMFTMMNTARLARRHAGPRHRRGRLPERRRLCARTGCRAARSSGAKAPDKPADPIIVHPDVRRMLLTMRAFTEGARALGYLGRHASSTCSPSTPTRRCRQDADDLVALMTPIVKALLHRHRLRGRQPRRAGATAATATSANGAWSSSSATPASPRSTRAPTASRRSTWSAASCRSDMGRLLRRFFHPVAAFIREAARERAAMLEFVGPLAKAFGKLQQATAWIAQKGHGGPEEAGAAATDYLAPVRAWWRWARCGRAWPRSRWRRRRGRRPTPASTTPSCDRALLHAAHAAGDRRRCSPDHGRQGDADGAGGRGVLTGGGGRHP